MTWTHDEIRAALRQAMTGTEQRGPRAWTATPTEHAEYSTPNREALRTVAGVAVDDWTTARYEAPARTPTLSGDVAVPAAQAVISGALAGILGGVAILATHVQLNGWAAVAVGVVVAAGTWAWLLRDHRRLLRNVESYTRRDVAPVQPAQASTVRLEVQQEHANGGRRWLYDELPVDRDRVLAWARAVLGGRSLAQSAWTGSAGPFSRSEYDALLAAMLKAGVIRWRNPASHAQGADLTPMGRATLRKLTEAEQ